MRERLRGASIWVRRTYTVLQTSLQFGQCHQVLGRRSETEQGARFRILQSFCISMSPYLGASVFVYRASTIFCRLSFLPPFDIACQVKILNGHDPVARRFFPSSVYTSVLTRVCRDTVNSDKQKRKKNKGYKTAECFQYCDLDQGDPTATLFLWKETVHRQDRQRVFKCGLPPSISFVLSRTGVTFPKNQYPFLST